MRLPSFLFFLLIFHSFSEDLSSITIASGTSGFAAPQHMTPLQSNQPTTPTTSATPAATEKPVTPYKPPPKPTAQNVSAVYTSPGIATLQGGRWVGNEHLYNLSPNLGVIVEVIQPANKTDINEEALKNHVLEVLKRGGLTPQGTVVAHPTPLPFLHILILLMPIENTGYSVFCSGRVLEEIEVNRVHLKAPIVWQGITWEKQELLVFPPDQLQTQLEKCVETLANAFVERFKAYSTQTQ